MQLLSKTSSETVQQASGNVIERFQHLSRYAMISILLVYILAACAPVCEVLPDTSFTATIMQVETSNGNEIVVRHNSTSVILQLSQDTSILDSQGKTINLVELVVGQQLSIQGLLLPNRRVDVLEIRSLF